MEGRRGTVVGVDRVEREGVWVRGFVGWGSVGREEDDVHGSEEERKDEGEDVEELGAAEE